MSNKVYNGDVAVNDKLLYVLSENRSIKRVNKIGRCSIKGDITLTSCLKLKRGGNGRPFGSRKLGSRSSSKKGWAHASSWIKIKTTNVKGNLTTIIYCRY